jgi:hypothetical protein
MGSVVCTVGAKVINILVRTKKYTDIINKNMNDYLAIIHNKLTNKQIAYIATQTTITN